MSQVDAAAMDAEHARVHAEAAVVAVATLLVPEVVSIMPARV